MGIRCECPNGHVLNLKAQLAGQRGICPECSARFQIPHGDGAEAGATDALQDTPLAGASLPEATSTRVLAAGAPAPQAVVEWRLQAPTGEVFGPADEATWDAWVESGRVTPECYVWRTGWDAWRLASEVEDLLPVPTAPPPIPAPRYEPQGNATPLATQRYLHRKVRQRAQSRRITAALALATLVIGVAFVYVLFWAL